MYGSITTLCSIMLPSCHFADVRIADLSQGDGVEQVPGWQGSLTTSVPKEDWRYSLQPCTEASEQQQQPKMKRQLWVKTGRWGEGKASAAVKKRKGEKKINQNCSQTRAESLFNSPPVVMFSHVELFSHPCCMPDPPHCKSVQREKKKKEKGDGVRERKKKK